MQFGCDDILNRICSDCPDEEKNRIIAIAFVKKATTIDVTMDISAQLLQAEKACQAVLFRQTNGTYDGGASSTGKGQGKQPTRILSKVHTIVSTDFDITNQVAFWNSFQRNPKGYYIIYFTDTKAWVSDKSISLTIDAKAPITDDYNTFIEGAITISWSAIDTSLPYTADTDVLEDCQELFESTVSSWTNESGSSATVIGSEISVGQGDTFEVSFDTQEDLFAATTTATLPAGVTLTVSGTKIIISGSSLSQGTTELPIVASNACGISGEVSVTLVITA